MRLVFWGVFVAGFLACSTVGIGPALRRAGGDWMSPAMIAGVVLGVAILALGVAFAAGIRPPMLTSDRAMVFALAGLVLAKVGVSAAQVAAVALSRG